MDFHGVDHDVDVLVPINLVRGNIMENGCVQPVVGDSTSVRGSASGVFGVDSVKNTEVEAEVGILISEVETAELIVGAASSALDGRHGIGQASKHRSRLDLVIN